MGGAGGKGQNSALEEGEEPWLQRRENRVSVALFELLVWPHEVEPWFHSWYRGRVETLDAKYNLIFR